MHAHLGVVGEKRVWGGPMKTPCSGFKKGRLRWGGFQSKGLNPRGFLRPTDSKKQLGAKGGESLAGAVKYIVSEQGCGSKSGKTIIPEVGCNKVVSTIAVCGGGG